MTPDAPDAPLQPQDLALTIVGAHVRETGERVWSGGMVRLLGDLGFSTEAARAALSRLVTRDLLSRSREGRRAFYALTERAEHLLEEGDRRIFSFGRGDGSDGVWTVLWHALPEHRRAERARVTARLRFLGFGSVQDATWVASRDHEDEVLALLSELGVERYASVVVGRMSAALPPVALVAQAWDLEGVRHRYERFLSDFRPLTAPEARDRLSPGAAFVARTQMLHRFRAFPLHDPELPEPLAGEKSLRTSVVELFDELYAALGGPAEEHFRTVAQPRFDGA